MTVPRSRDSNMSRNSRTRDTDVSKISVRFTSSQRAVLEERARASGKTLSEYVRGVATGEDVAFSLHDVKIHMEEIDSAMGYLALMMEQNQASLTELATAILLRLPDITGTDQEKSARLEKVQNLVGRALDNSARNVAKVHVTPDAPGLRDPMRMAEISDWSSRLSREKGKD